MEPNNGAHHTTLTRRWWRRALAVMNNMMNLKSLFAILALIGLFLVALGFVRFGIDIWGYYHDPDVGVSRVLNYRGLGSAFIGIVIFAALSLLCLRQKH